MRGSASLFVSLAMALGAIGLAFAAPGRGDDRALLDFENASGAVIIANSRDGLALFSAAGLRPGDEVSGAVRIGNAGDVAGRFSVRATGVQDTPGANGGLLSQRVELTLLDVTDAQHPVTVFAGHAADFDGVELGTLAAGDDRDYVLAATLPDGGAGDNAYQGAGLSVGLLWQAGPADVSTATPTPTPTPPPPTRPKVTPTPPVVAVDLADVLGLPSASKCLPRASLRFTVKAPDGAKVVAAKVSATGKKKLRLKGRKVRQAVTLRRLRKTATVKLTVRASNGRIYTASRVYRSCKR